MNKLIGIGELIIDFQSVGLASIKDTKEFVKNPGGAPANVCVQVAKNGYEVVYASKVGNDGFGDFLIEALKVNNVDTSNVVKSKEYQTSLAFVSFLENGEREFSFFRKMAADLYFTSQDFENINFDKTDIFEFGSVALKTDVARQTHDYLINKAAEAGSIICFDPNVRLNLWEDHNELKDIINKYIECADVIKVSDDESLFITGEETYEAAIKKLFKGNVKVILLTKGANGATIYVKNGNIFNHCGYKVKAVDTTGAGDSFFGGFITKLLDNKLTKETLNSDFDYNDSLDFACKCGAFTTTGYGAISAMGNRETIESVGK